MEVFPCAIVMPRRPKKKAGLDVKKLVPLPGLKNVPLWELLRGTWFRDSRRSLGSAIANNLLFQVVKVERNPSNLREPYKVHVRGMKGSGTSTLRWNLPVRPYMVIDGPPMPRGRALPDLDC